MGEAGLGECVRVECGMRLRALLDHRPHRPPHTVPVTAPDPGGHGAHRSLAWNCLLDTPLVNGEAPRAWVVSGQPGTGKTTLALHLARSWLGRAKHSIHRYQGVLVVSGVVVARDGLWEAVKEQLDDTASRWGAAELAKWLEEAQVLFIIDDFAIWHCREALEGALEEWTAADFLLLTKPEDSVGTRNVLRDVLPTLSLSLPGLAAADWLSMAATHMAPRDLRAFQGWLEGRVGAFGELLRYPALVEPLCGAWRTGRIKPSIVTLTELLWGVVEYLVSKNKFIKIDQVEQWLSIVGRMARESLENRLPILQENLEQELNRVLTGEMLRTALDSLCPSKSATLPATLSFPHPLSQFLAGWDAVHQNLHGTPMKALTKRTADEDTIVLFAAGHLARLMARGEDLAVKNITRAAKNLVLHMDRAKDRFGYTLRVIYECRAHPDVMQIMIKEVEFSKYWEIRNTAILLEPVTVLLNHTKPSKIQISVEKNMAAPDLLSVLTHISKTSYPLFVAEMNHLKWENTKTSDDLINILQEGTAKLEDFIGCLSTATIESLAQHSATSGLVCLRLRVCDMAAAAALFRTPEHLHSLMWLEVDFDMPVCDIIKDDLPEVSTPLMDVCFKDVSDEDVQALCEILAHVRKIYSGVHLKRSSLTPSGVVSILKFFYKHDMVMTAPPDVIKRYRRWRFPALGVVGPGEELSDDKAKHLLGYDDRHHYSDNEVFSSAIVTESEANYLAHFCRNMRDLVCLKYVCATFSVTKNTDGSVQVVSLV